MINHKSDPRNEPIPSDMISQYIVLELMTAEIHEKSDFGPGAEVTLLLP